MPVIGAVHTRGAVGGIQTDTIGGITRPSSNSKLSASLVGKSDTSSTENVGLDVHLSPCKLVLVDQRQVELISTGRVGFTSAPFLKESDLASDGLSGHQGNADTSNELLIGTSSGSASSREAPRVKGCSGPEVSSEARTTTADGAGITRAGDAALRLGPLRSTRGLDVLWVAAVALLTILQAGSHVTKLGTLVKALRRGHGVGEDVLPKESTLLVDIVFVAALVGPVADLLDRSRRLLDRRGSLGDDAHSAAAAAVFGRVTGARSVAVALVGSFGTAVDNVVTAEALLGVLSTGNGKSLRGAGLDTRLEGQVIIVGELGIKNAAIDSVHVTSIGLPSLRESSRLRRS